RHGPPRGQLLAPGDLEWHATAGGRGWGGDAPAGPAAPGWRPRPRRGRSAAHVAGDPGFDLSAPESAPGALVADRAPGGKFGGAGSGLAPPEWGSPRGGADHLDQAQ